MSASILRMPRVKLWVALGCLGVLALAGLRGQAFAWVARGALGLSAAGALAFWLILRRREVAGFAAPQRLQVVCRATLTPRCAAALIEADGGTFVVVHGEGFAEIREAPPRRTAQSRRPLPIRRQAAR